jgi:mRNA-degrading endonuclease RelE of RelBE toxin-antitoxin system
MMLVLTRPATKDFLAMPKGEREQMRACLEAIAGGLGSPDSSVTAVKGGLPGRFRVRQGDWRASYAVFESNVVTIRITRRTEVND